MESSPSIPLSWKWQVAISLVLLFHLSAIALFPFTVPPASRLARWVFSWPVYRHYVEVMYLDHGYKFFAPNPGTRARSVRYVLEYADGTTKEGIFPDRERHQPRLRYHRHFMLTEHLPVVPPRYATKYQRHLGVADPGAPTEPPPGPPILLPQYVESYGSHLLKVSGAERVTLYEQLHYVPVIEDVERGMELDDPLLFEQRYLGTVTADGRVEQ